MRDITIRRRRKKERRHGMSATDTGYIWKGVRKIFSVRLAISHNLHFQDWKYFSTVQAEKNEKSKKR